MTPSSNASCFASGMTSGGLLQLVRRCAGQRSCRGIRCPAQISFRPLPAFPTPCRNAWLIGIVTVLAQLPMHRAKGLDRLVATALEAFQASLRLRALRALAEFVVFLNLGRELVHGLDDFELHLRMLRYGGQNSRFPGLHLFFHRRERSAPHVLERSDFSAPKMNHRVAALGAGPVMTKNEQSDCAPQRWPPRLARGHVGDHRHGRREIMLKHLVGINASLITARAGRLLDLIIVMPGAHLHDIADIRQRIGQRARRHQDDARRQIGMNADIDGEPAAMPLARSIPVTK